MSASKQNPDKLLFYAAERWICSTTKDKASIDRLNKALEIEDRPCIGDELDLLFSYIDGHPRLNPEEQ